MGYWTYLFGATVLSGIVKVIIDAVVDQPPPPKPQIRIYSNEGIYRFLYNMYQFDSVFAKNNFCHYNYMCQNFLNGRLPNKRFVFNYFDKRCGICREELSGNTPEIQCKRRHTFHKECVDSFKNEGQRNCIECGEDFVP